jgi:hypothetical protein
MNLIYKNFLHRFNKGGGGGSPTVILWNANKSSTKEFILMLI